MYKNSRIGIQYLYEIPLFFVFICWINWRFFPDNMGFWETNPHPYWLAVLLFSLRYNLSSAILSGIFSAGLYFLIAISPWDLWTGRDIFVFDDPDFYYLPISFIVLSIIMGVVSESSRKKLNFAENLVEILKSQEQPYNDEIKTLKQVNRELEKKIVTQMSSLITVYEGARRLESNEEDDLYSAILVFFCKTLSAEAGCIHRFESGKLTLHNSFGHGQSQLRNLEEIQMGRGLIGQSCLKKKIFTIADFSKEHAEIVDETNTLISGPLFFGEKGELAAVLSIQKIPLFKLNSAMTNLFLFLLNWGSRSLGRLQERQYLTQNIAIDPDDGLYTEKYFYLRLSQEFATCKKYYLPLSVLLIHIEGWNGLNASQHKTLRQLFAEVFHKTFRKTDVVAKGNQSYWHYAVLMITCAEKEAREIVQKFNTHIQSVLGEEIPVQLRLGFSSFAPIHGSESNLLDEATKRMAA